jgi:hypothetical protein
VNAHGTSTNLRNVTESDAIGNVFGRGVGCSALRVTPRLKGAGVMQIHGIDLGAANRDPRRFASPDLFDTGRPSLQHVNFGGGAYFCIGAALSRLEGRVAFPRIFRRFPGLAPAGPPVRSDHLLLRGYAELPVKLD